MNNKINHEGEIIEINEDVIRVRILQHSACAGCHAKSNCSVSDSREKIIDIPNTYNSLEKGKRVKVELDSSMGYMAVIYAFVFPICIIFAVFTFLLYLKFDEALAGLMSILALTIYYIGLYFFRNRLSKKIVFTIVND